MTTITMKQGEGKTLVFTVSDADGVIDVSSATLTYTIKIKKSSVSYVLQKDHADFDVTNAATGIVKCTLSETDTDLSPRLYYSELKVWFSTTSVEKSRDILFNLERAIN